MAKINATDPLKDSIEMLWIAYINTQINRKIHQVTSASRPGSSFNSVRISSLYLLNWFCKIIQPQFVDHIYVSLLTEIHNILDRSTTEDSRQSKRREETHELIAVPGDLMGFVIGKKGSSIKEIQMESGAKLISDSDQTGFLVSGNKEQRALARELVQQKVVSL